MNKESLGYTIVFSFIVAFAFVFFLSLTNEITKDRIATNAELRRLRAILTAMDIPYSSDAEVEERFREVETLQREGQTLYAFDGPGGRVWAQQFAGQGLWGTIFGVLSVNETVDEVIGLEIISHNETPGLGGRIDEPWFKDQFRDLRIEGAKITLTSGAEAGAAANKEAGIVDGITGASRTSQYMRDMVNRELANLKELIGGAQ